MKKIILLIAIITTICLGSTYLVKQNGFYYPSHSKIDLIPILTKPILTSADYQIILEQTGIYQPIVDQLQQTPSFVARMLEFQKEYYDPINIVKTNMSIITRWDQFLIAGKRQKVFELAPYQNGDIFLTKSTYTFNWRHGHAGIVVDAANGYVLESFSPGSVSRLQKAENWEYYTTFKMLRPVGKTNAFLDDVAANAIATLSGIPYNILAFKHSKKPPNITHCAHIIWQAYIPFKMNIDSNRGLFVSPQDIAKSDLLEPLQVFGFDPNTTW
ncbi:hypothetical protein [Candidatus Epulonipiscium viviparus]|uniref:hypothetical protein n=1 Tax=Candidatus Epulonipiscium viviparus TaxID=420336 RepID=UPI0027380DF9|nr:hypothetical protein [Candidatus Epulopiscium viviparus]